MQAATRTYLFLLCFVCYGSSVKLKAQTNLLLNGSFEDINVCSEYKAECGVEGWFYLKDVKTQMLANLETIPGLGNNSYGIYYTWNSYKQFSPVIGSLLPCRLQAGKGYTFKGVLSAKLNARLVFEPGIALGEFFYVPGRPFAKNITPVAITDLEALGKEGFYSFRYHFTATGNEKYFTFGSYIHQDTTTGKRDLIGTQTISIVLDNFSLEPDDPTESFCPGFEIMKTAIYAYDSRHKELDYALYGRGALPIRIEVADSDAVTRQRTVPPPLHTDTLKLGDVLFDFNRATLKPEAAQMLGEFFTPGRIRNIDSIYIDGHTDSIGSVAGNVQLSQSRCESVQHWMNDNGITDAGKIRIRPFGKARPIATNSTVAGRRLNRRVEIIIFRSKEE